MPKNAAKKPQAKKLACLSSVFSALERRRFLTNGIFSIGV